MRIHSFALGLALALAACGGKSNSDTSPRPAAQEASLYDRLGKRDAIAMVVDDFVNNCAADERINARFKNIDAKALKDKLTDQICEATGGPCKYAGVHKDMRTAHVGMKITEAEFNAMVEDLVKSLDKFKVGEREKQELLGALGGMKGDIVGV